MTARGVNYESLKFRSYSTVDVDYFSIVLDSHPSFRGRSLASNLRVSNRSITNDNHQAQTQQPINHKKFLQTHETAFSAYLHHALPRHSRIMAHPIVPPPQSPSHHNPNNNKIPHKPPPKTHQTRPTTKSPHPNLRPIIHHNQNNRPLNPSPKDLRPSLRRNFEV